jgi:hypothetical protein
MARSPIPEGFYGFSARSQLPQMGGIRLLACLADPARPAPIKQFHPVVKVSGLLRRCTATFTNAVQTIASTGAPTGGTFTLTATINGVSATTAPIPFNATAAQLQTALLALVNIGNSNLGPNVTTTGGPIGSAGVPVTFRYDLSSQPIATMTVNYSGLTGGTSPTITVTNSTTGVVGVMTQASFSGFSDEWEAGNLDAYYPRSFAQAPVELDLPFAGMNASGVADREIKYFPLLPGNIYTGNLLPTVTATKTLVTGSGINLGYNGDYDRFYVDPNNNGSAAIKIIGVVEGDEGILGGKVDFMVLQSVSQLTP